MTRSDSTPPSSTKARRPSPIFTGRGLALGLLAGLLAGCGTFHSPQFPPPVREPKPEVDTDDVLRAENQERSRPLVEQQARPPLSGSAAAKGPAQATPQAPIRKPVAIVLDGVPLETFINVVYGMELGFAVQIDRAIRDRPDLVSLRITSAQPPEKVYEIAREVLVNYGVQVGELGGVLRFTPAGAGSAEFPKVLATRSLPDVPAGQRTVFVAMPLEASNPGAVAGQLRSMFNNQGVTLTEMPEANAIMVSGPGDSVRAVMQAVTTLDRASLSNRRSLRINPLYVPVDLLARELRDLLAGQGVAVRTGPGSGGAVNFVPVGSANALIVFAESEDVLNLVSEWAQRLDQPSDDGAGGGVFMYSARHTTVETLIPVLEALIGSQSAGQGAAGGGSDAATQANGLGNAAASSQQGSGSRAANAVSSMTGAHGQIAIDPVRNVIVYQGEAERWRSIQGVLARLDQPARQVVIEVTVAEVTLTDEFANGVEWAFQNISVNGVEGPLGLLTGLAGSGGTVIWEGISRSGQVKALLNLFARDSRVSILSTPRILVKSGESASIDVGNEVPIITSQATAPDLPTSGGDSSILQSIQYRKTGVLLDITAVVHSGQRVDIKLTQEVSEASTTDTSDISSPSIFSRKLQTSLSLQDGESTLLGGLISRNHSAGKTKVPLLGDIPVLGAAFQSRRAEGTRTELLMLITPYVLEDASQARAITDAIRARFAPRPAWNGGLLLQDGLEPEMNDAPLLPPAPATVPVPAAPVPPAYRN